MPMTEGTRMFDRRIAYDFLDLGPVMSAIIGGFRRQIAPWDNLSRRVM